MLGDDFNEEATLATETTTPAIISDADFAAAMNDVVVTFTADLAPATTTPAAVAVAVAETPKTTEVEPATEISDKLAEEMASLFKTETQNLMESSKPAPPLFEPMVVAENLDNDFAYELNRKSDGRELHEIAVSPSSTGRLGQFNSGEGAITRKSSPSTGSLSSSTNSSSSRMGLR